MAEIIVPTPGESVTEVEIGTWLVEDGSWVETDQEIVSLESEKATLEVNATASGLLRIMVPDGEAVAVGSVIATIDESAEKPEGAVSPKPQVEEVSSESKTLAKKIAATEERTEKVKITPVASKLMEEYNLSIDDVLEGIKRIGKKDIQMIVDNKSEPSNIESGKISRESSSSKMSLLRRKVAERLVAVKNETAMLTTFNEVDMSAVMALRNQYKAKFLEKHGTKLGFMSFFTLAVSRSLNAFPQINSMIDGQNMITFDYHDIGIAVQTPKGLMVPAIRNVETMGIAEIEKAIAALADKARNNKITIDELDGGTFSITNGGVFGSLLSTPIINPPQSAILGMHNIVDRPVAFEGQVVIRPMMYLALSYDHRLVDGKDSVGLLKTIKELIENPYKLLDTLGKPEKGLLGL